MNIGYARVSSYGQSLAVQIHKLHQQHCSEIFEEKVSALSQRRPEQENANCIITAYKLSIPVIEKETPIDMKDFPTECPYTFEQIIDNNFYPEKLS